MPSLIRIASCRSAPFCLLALLLLPGCQTTVASVVEDATTTLLERYEPPAGRPQMVAVVGSAEGGNRAASQDTLYAIWEHLDKRIVNHPKYSCVSPDLVRSVLDRIDVEASELYTQDHRGQFLRTIEKEGQRPDLLLFLKLSALQKSGTGFKPPALLISLELLEADSGRRLAKESARVILSSRR